MVLCKSIDVVCVSGVVYVSGEVCVSGVVLLPI
jgi:hypothetical protein